MNDEQENDTLATSNQHKEFLERLKNLAVTSGAVGNANTFFKQLPDTAPLPLMHIDGMGDVHCIWTSEEGYLHVRVSKYGMHYTGSVNFEVVQNSKYTVSGVDVSSIDEVTPEIIKLLQHFES